jgi:hypothetical protein
MRADGRLALLLGNTAVALIGAAVMYALVSTVDPRRSDESETEPPEMSEETSPDSRPTPFDTLARLRPPERDPELLQDESEAPWSTEAHEEKLAPRVGPQGDPLSSLRAPFSRAPDPKAAQRPYYTLKARLAEIAPLATPRLTAKFEAAKAAWPPSEIVFIAIKDEKALELHARSAGQPWKFIHRYKVLAASGGAGPKLRQGDRQVPEGIYGIALLNPNSAYHVSLRVNYPNAFDRQMADKEGRKELGGDIMIHGKNLSAGCLAMGDEAVEEIFVLAAQAGLANVKLIIAPTDLRQKAVPAAEPGRPEWLPKLYTEVATQMAEYKVPPSPSLLSFFFGK